MINLEQEDIMKNWDISYKTPLVSIKCMAYNHEKYICDTLDGFLMQKTNFPFVIIVHDDASTDKTADIIHEYENKYPDIIKPIYETENQYSNPNSSITNIMLPFLKSKYIAFCEGDDYWIDENKLQNQVNFLENHENYGMSYSTVKQFYQESHRFSKNVVGSDYKSFKNLLINSNCIPTVSVLIRKSIMDNYLSEYNEKSKDWIMGDYPLWLYTAKKSCLYFDEKTTAVYRVLTNSASHFTDYTKKVNFINATYEIKKFFSIKYKCMFDFESQRFMSLSICAFSFNKKKEGLEYLQKVNILNAKKNLIRYCFLRIPILRKYYIKRVNR